MGVIIEKAREKLQGELESATNKSFAEPVIGYLLERINESESLATDICQEHKKWNKCFAYIYEQARKIASGSSCVVKNDVVYEWAEDYYRKDDKKEEEKKARKEKERKAKQKPVQKGKEKKEKREKSVAKKVDHVNDELNGQMDIFSFLG